MSHASYLSQLVPSNFKNTVAEMAHLIRREFPACNAIFGRGLSSAMLLPALAAELDTAWLIVRKGEETHSCYKVEASEWPDDTKAVYVDDLIDSGTSFQESLAAITKAAKAQTKRCETEMTFECLGAACYASECCNLDEYKTVYL